MHSLFFFIIALSLLVVIHEYGHFWVARRCGVKVLTFSVGFGKALWSRVGKDGTEYVLAAIPLGGYVKMLDEREAEVPAELQAQAFNRQSLGARTAIVLAGPVANLLLAVVAYWLFFTLGLPGVKPVIGNITPDSPAAQISLQHDDEIYAINGQNTPTWISASKILRGIADEGGIARIKTANKTYELAIPKAALDISAGKLLSQLGMIPRQLELLPVIGELSAQGVAQRDGLQSGDLILSMDGKQVDSWQHWVKLIQASPDQTVEIQLQRAGLVQSVLLTPGSVVAEGKAVGRIGAGVDVSQTPIPEAWQAKWQYGPITAIKYAIMETWDFSRRTLMGIIGMIRGKISSDNVGGPIAIAQFVGASAQQGLVTFIASLAMISISLGILNLLPIPILDGGHLAFYLVEWIRGRPLSDKVQFTAQKIGLFILLMVMVLAFSNDLSRWVGL